MPNPFNSLGALGTITIVVSAVVFAGLVPVSIMISRDRLRHYRRELLLDLEEWMVGLGQHRQMPSFEAARIKYELQVREGANRPRRPGDAAANPAAANRAPRTRDTWPSYLIPGLIYVVLTTLGFLTAMLLAGDSRFWSNPNFILSGMFKEFPASLPSTDLTNYQWHSGAVITAGFIGSYLFTLQYLIQRVRAYELGPVSFLVASISIIEGCFVVSIVRHLMADASVPQSIALAFLIGYFPTFGVVVLVERLKIAQLKSMDRNAYRQRFLMPTDMIDGIDMLTKFRLMEAGIRDVQNLATANPVLVYVETPYGLLAIVDWIAQAQLILAVGSDIASQFRAIGVRTIFDIPPFTATDEGRLLILSIGQPELAKKPTPENFNIYLGSLNRDIHVQRLLNFFGVMESLMDGGTPRGKYPVGLPSQPTDQAAAAQ